MSKVSIWGLLCLILSFSTVSKPMEYIPKAFKKPAVWGAIALAAVVSGTIYYIDYTLDAPNRNLVQGVREGDAKKVALALYDGAEHDRRAKDGSTLLHYVVQLGHYDLVPLLTQSSLGARPLINFEDAKGNTPLYYAVQKEDARMVKLLLKAGANRFCCNDMTQDFEAKLEHLSK